ncbi:lasso peptide biosynthesis B2 protein [Geodermatophilus sp. SYSU D01036]
MPWRQWPEVARVLLVTLLVEVGLHVTTLPRLTRWCGIRLDVTSGPLLDAPPVHLARPIRHQARIVYGVLRRWPFGDTCLRRCLVLGQRVRDLEPVLRIGVGVGEDGGFTAHSWLEIQGQSLDVESRSFRQFGADA